MKKVGKPEKRSPHAVSYRVGRGDTRSVQPGSVLYQLNVVHVALGAGQNVDVERVRVEVHASLIASGQMHDPGEIDSDPPAGLIAAAAERLGPAKVARRSQLEYEYVRGVGGIGGVPHATTRVCPGAGIKVDRSVERTSRVDTARCIHVQTVDEDARRASRDIFGQCLGPDQRPA